MPCVFHCLFGHERRFGIHNLLALAPRLAATYIARISGKACGGALSLRRWTPVWNRGPGDEARRALAGLGDDVELLVAQFCLRLADARVHSLQLRRAERAHEVRLFPIRAQRPLLLGAAAHEVRDGDLGLLFEGRAHLVGELVHLVFVSYAVRRCVCGVRKAARGCARSGLQPNAAAALARRIGRSDGRADAEPRPICCGKPLFACAAQVRAQIPSQQRERRPGTMRRIELGL